MGAHTAPASIVMVSSQDAESCVSPMVREISGNSGTTRVCISDTVTPHPQSTIMSRPDRRARDREPVFTHGVNRCSPHPVNRM